MENDQINQGAPGQEPDVRRKEEAGQAGAHQTAAPQSEAGQADVHQAAADQAFSEKTGRKAASGSRRKKTAGTCVGIVMRSMFRVLKVMFLTLFIICVIGVLAAGGFAYYKLYPIYRDYKENVEEQVKSSTPDSFRLQEASYIYDVHGEVLAKLTGDEDSTYLTYDEIPQDAINAFVAIEDRTFWENPGIDIKGIIRVGINYLRTDGAEKHGASTITQQLARNRFLTREVSIERKIKEMLAALELTEKYTKEQIMEFYINDISFANTYYGLQAAARGYFGKDADELTLSQTAYLCAIPNSPTYYNPYRHPENAIERRDKILNDMLEMGYITQEEYRSALAETIAVKSRGTPLHNYETTYAVDCAIRWMMERDGFEFQYGFQDQEAYEEYEARYNEFYEQERNALYTGGYTLYTSLDPQMQEIVQAAVDEGLSFDEDTTENGVYLLQGAATVIDNETGLVTAIVGGRSQETDTYTLNRAFQSDRQPGSAVKPLIVYTPALENGFRSTTEVPNISIDAAKEPGVDVEDLSGSPLTLRRGVELSRNGVAWYIYDNLTPQLGLAYLTQMRFDNIVPNDYYPATSLGGFTHGATTEEMAGAYAALANGGVYRDPTCLVRVVDNKGNDVFTAPSGVRVYQENSALLMTDILTGVIRRGTASSMGWSGEIEAAGKTGTTNGSKDGWFCGMTPYYTLSVWVGYDQPRMLSSLYGGTYPASIWKSAMEKLVEGLEPASFADPESDLGMGGTDEYLAGHDGAYEISDGYTVAQFRADHELADEAICLLEKIGDEAQSMSRSERRAAAADRIDQIESPSMKERMENIWQNGDPIRGRTYVETPPTAAPVQPVETVPAETEAPAPPRGPSEDTFAPPQAYGPGMESAN